MARREPEDEGPPIGEQSLTRRDDDPGEAWSASVEEYAAIVQGDEVDEQPAVLKGRLQAIEQDRNDLRAWVHRLLDERAIWVQMLKQVMAERDEMKRL
jgi:hypothetical protein